MTLGGKRHKQGNMLVWSGLPDRKIPQGACLVGAITISRTQIDCGWL